MTTLQQFFKHEREVSERKKIAEKKRLERLNRPKVVVEKVIEKQLEDYEEVDTLLKRNWFVDDFEIIDLMWDVNEDVYTKIMENVDSYSARVRNILIENFKPEQLLKKQAKVMTDEDLYRIYQEQQKEIDERIENAWQTYKTEHGLYREESELDTKLIELEDKLSKAKKSLEELSNTSKRYIAPSMRAKMMEEENANKDKVRNQMREFENKINEVKTKLKEEESKWENEKKSEYINELWESMC